MKVTFADFGPTLASARLRANIPQRELAKLGVSKGLDVLVYSKDWISPEDILRFGKKVYDVCDNHYQTESKREYYLKHTLEADLVTCNSEVMKQVIKEETGRDAIVIPEPYESEEREPDIGPLLYWFGHRSNILDITRLKPDLKQPLKILTNLEGYGEWTKYKHDEVMKHPLIVVIPTGKSLAKSENRMVESIRQGRYVCAEFLPAYKPFSAFFPMGDIPAHIEQALSDPNASKAKIHQAQEFIKDRYSPETISTKWLEVINGIK